MSLAFHHHAILVSDLARAEAFYGGVLGLVVKQRWFDEHEQPRSIRFELETGFLAVELHGGAKPPNSSDSGHHCFALAIESTEREPWLARFAAANVPIEKRSDFSLYVRDPEGNQIALSHWPRTQNRPKPRG